MARRTSLEERVRMVEWAEAGMSDRQIAERLGCSKETVRKWRRRGLKAGRSGLASQMGRPRRGALSTYPVEIGTALHQWRQAHPGWGPQTLRAELGADERFAHQGLPSLATIGRFLREQGLTRRYERHSDLPQSAQLKAGEPHAVWEMDARGHSYVPEVGMVGLINLNDRFSHLRLLSYPCWLGQKRAQRYPSTEDYQIAVRLAFTDWGFPQVV
jgi:transposase